MSPTNYRNTLHHFIQYLSHHFQQTHTHTHACTHVRAHIHTHTHKTNDTQLRAHRGTAFRVLRIKDGS